MFISLFFSLWSYADNLISSLVPIVTFECAVSRKNSSRAHVARMRPASATKQSQRLALFAQVCGRQRSYSDPGLVLLNRLRGLAISMFVLTPMTILVLLAVSVSLEYHRTECWTSEVRPNGCRWRASASPPKLLCLFSVRNLVTLSSSHEIRCSLDPTSSCQRFF